MVAPPHFSLIMTHSFLVKISASSLLLFQTEKRFRNADVVFLLVIIVCCVGLGSGAKGEMRTRVVEEASGLGGN
jgi:hypothetical protein